MRLLAEWERQSRILLTFPHKFSDWNYCLDSARKTFIRIIDEIIQIEPCIVGIDPRDEDGLNLLCEFFGIQKDESGLREGVLLRNGNLTLVCVHCNDTWSRDFAPLSVVDDLGKICLLNFGFNGWGLKFASHYDNQISQKLKEFGLFSELKDMDLILEGGSVDSDGMGSILTTSQCLLEKNRNPHLNREQIEEKLKEYFGLKRVLWLESGYLAGDDTDSHIDTLARFLNPETIAYMACEDEEDEHYKALAEIEKELRALRQIDGKPYRLVPLYLPDIRESRFTQDSADDRHRLPASYVNFLILNDGVLLLPTYGVERLDRRAYEALSEFYRVVCIDCSTLIRQHGSLHCVSMQLYD